jgi:hypothetical protein
MNFSTDFTENDIVFGGDKKLKKALKEIDVLFPLNNGITIQSECPIGLIGDDIQAVAKVHKKESDKPTIAISRCSFALWCDKEEFFSHVGAIPCGCPRVEGLFQSKGRPRGYAPTQFGKTYTPSKQH